MELVVGLRWKTLYCQTYLPVGKCVCKRRIYENHYEFMGVLPPGNERGIESYGWRKAVRV